MSLSAPIRALALAAAGAAALAGNDAAAGAGDFFAGKSIDLVVGAGSGGGYDIYARALARHLGNHLPGQPTIVVKNMPGAGSVKAAQFVSNLAPKDGTAIAAVMPGAIMGPLLDEKSDSTFDPTKALYLGTANNGTRVCITLKPSSIRTFDDVLTHRAVFGGVSSNDSTREYGFMFKAKLGAKYDIVTGYKGTTDLALALERGEVDGVCGWDWSSIRSQKADWVRDGKLNVLLQAGLEPNPELTAMGVPSIWNYVKDDDTRKVVELVISQQVFQRPYFVPAGTPPDHLAALRAAFDATMADPQFRDDAKKIHIDIEPLPGTKVQEVVQKLYATPKAVVEEARRATNR